MHRLTFSKSLATLITDKYSEYELERFEFKVGKKLELGEVSKSGLYAIVAKNGDLTLRISLIKEIAELQYDENSRYLAEAWIIK